MEGKKHDYNAFKEEFPETAPPPQLLKGFSLYTDLGYLGIEKAFPWLNIKIAKKRPKRKELTSEEKLENRRINSIRVKVEHAICGVKRFAIVSGIFRNRKESIDDKAMEVVCGLWNYHLSYANQI